MDKIQLTKTFGIYKIKSLIDSKLYVGSTAKSFKVASPAGTIYEDKNLNAFCRKMSLTAFCMSLVLNKKQKSHRGWTLA